MAADPEDIKAAARAVARVESIDASIKELLAEAPHRLFVAVVNHLRAMRATEDEKWGHLVDFPAAPCPAQTLTEG